MGIPSFFKWLREKYPQSIQKGTQHLVPRWYHNLYVDMNGLIHAACRSEECNQYGVAEADMLEWLLGCVAHLVRLVQPRGVLYLALDGVAPRAKLNQQRARRYEAARRRRAVLEDISEASEDAAAVARDMADIRESLDLGIFGKDLDDHDASTCSAPSESDAASESTPSIGPLPPGTPPQCDSGADILGWDSNCITPGSVFMAKVAAALRSFITAQQADDPHWQQLIVILSDSNTYGEGEHKIAAFVRAQRCQPSYDPNTRHLICGADSDFIMLALALHEPHCDILRERRQAGIALSPDATAFDVVSVGCLRECLALEFRAKLRPGGAPFDLESLLDDFVVLCFFVGNDFLPHLPSCLVDCFALDNLLELYFTTHRSLGGHFVEKGALNFPRLGRFLAQYALAEDCQFTRVARAQHAKGGLAGADREAWRATYYHSVGVASVEDRTRMCREYARGLAWVWQYYTSNVYRAEPRAPLRKVHSYETAALWRWYYPYHYAPLAHDLADFLLGADPKALADLVSYQRYSARPFAPFTQLLAVLPPDSVRLLPPCYRVAVEAAASPLRPFYPERYGIDPAGHPQEWKAVVLLPFLEEGPLLSAVEELEGGLDFGLAPTEQERNVNRPASLLLCPARHPLAPALAALSPKRFEPLPAAAHTLSGLAMVTDADATESASVIVEILDPAIPPRAALRRLCPGVVLPSPRALSPRRLGGGGPQLLDVSQFYGYCLVLAYSVVALCEVAPVSRWSTFGGTVAWLLHVTALAAVHRGAGPRTGVVVPPLAEHQAKLRPARPFHFRFLHDCPVGAYQDWVCPECLSGNFVHNQHCFDCGRARGSNEVTLFQPKQMTAGMSHLVIDHQQDLLLVRGWPRSLPAPA